MMEQDLATRQAIHDFVVSTFLFDNGDVAEDASLLGEGIMDSTGVLELILFVEETFAISVADDEILPENFDSIARIAAYVERKGGPGLAAAGAVAVAGRLSTRAAAARVRGEPAAPATGADRPVPTPHRRFERAARRVGRRPGRPAA